MSKELSPEGAIDAVKDLGYGILIRYEHINRYEIALNEIIKQYHDNNKKINILDLGCGYGYGRQILNDKNIEYFGIDVSSTSLKKAKKRYDGDYAMSIGQKIPIKDEVFDIVLFFEVIEHIENPTDVFYEICRCLKKDGVLLISTGPNIDYIPKRLFTFLSNLYRQEKKKFSNPYHVREYSFKSFKEELVQHKNSFSLIVVRGHNILPPIIGDFILYITPKIVHYKLINIGRYFPSQARDFIAIMKKI